MNKNYLFGIGTVLAVLLVFTVPVMAGPNTVYFVPSSSTACPDEIAYVEAWLNMTDPHGTYGDDYALSSIWINITFDPSIGDIIDCNRIFQTIHASSTKRLYKIR